MQKTFFAILFLILPVSLTAQQAFISVDRDSVGVGDFVNVSIVVENVPNMEVIYPDSAQFGEDFDFIQRRIFRQADKDSAVYRLQFFGTSDTEIPEIELAVVSNGDTLTAAIPAFPLHFVSLVPGDDDDLRPMKPLYEFTRSLWPFLLLLILAGIASYAAYTWYTKHRNQKPATDPIKIPEPPPFLDPLQNLERRISEMDKKFPNPTVDFKSYFSELTDVIRNYFEEMHHIPALESTSSELLRDLKRNYVDDQTVKLTAQILKMADMVKFAKFTPTTQDAITTRKSLQIFSERVRMLDTESVELKRKQYNAHLLQLKNQLESEEVS